MKVSIIVPTYKPQDYLWECLYSLITQTIPTNEFEVIIVLNGEKDPYFNKITTWLKNNGCSNVRLLYTDVPGVSNARNIGMRQSLGQYVCFVDDDDYVSNNYLDGLLQYADADCVSLAHPIAFDENDVCKNYRIEKTYYSLKGKGRLPYYKARKFFGGPCMKMIHKNMMGGVEYDVNFRNSEDALFMFEISKNLRYVECAKEDVIYYRRIRQGSANQSTSFIERINNQIKLVVRYCKIYFKQPGQYNRHFFLTRLLGAAKTIFFK